MVHYILSPRAPVMETLLALEISEALERRAHALQQPATPHGRNGAAAQTKEAELLRDLIVVTPGCRDLSEIMWYPHAAAWSQLRAPLLFWPPQTSEPGLLTASRPVIVTPLDGHTHSEQAIPYACALAALFNGKVVLLHVIPPTAGAPGMAESPALQRSHRIERARAMRRYLSAIRANTTREASVEVRTKILLGAPGTTMVELARRHGADAIVMTTHSEARGGRFFAGAVATQVIRQSSAPTLLIALGAETVATQREATQRETTHDALRV